MMKIRLPKSLELRERIKRQLDQLAHRSRAKMLFDASLLTSKSVSHLVLIAQRYEFECIRPDGTLRWRDYIDNLVVLEGRNNMLDEYYTASAYNAVHYVFLTDDDPVFADGDTMATHPGWTENVAYSEGSRPLLQMGTASNGSIDNDASRAVYSINASTSIGGAGVTTDNAKGGATGLLIAGGALVGGNKPFDNGDTLRQRVIANMTSS